MTNPISILKTGILLMYIALLYSCATGMQAYQKGDYYKACNQAIKRLKSDPKNEKAKFVLVNGYPLAEKNANRQIGNILARGDAANYDLIVSHYQQMNNLANAIYKTPKANELIPSPSEYYDEIRQSTELVAQVSYNAGLKAMAAGGLDQARVAYDQFVKANKYVPGYLDVDRKIEEARYAATLRVIVQPPMMNPSSQYTGDYFYTQLMSMVTRRTYKNFVRFYTPVEAANEGMRDPHQYLVLNFEDFNVGSTRETINNEDIKRDNVVIGTTKVNGVNQDVIGTVTAKFTTVRREIVSGGVMSLKAINAANNRVVSQKNFTSTTTWRGEYATYKGDERALTREQIALTNAKPPVIPAPQVLFNEAVSELYAQAATFISSVY